MEAFLDCSSCAGFVPHAANVCPHCGSAVATNKKAKAQGKPGLLGAVATAAVGGLMSITLMACYGVGYTCESSDVDGDGYDANGECGPADCNDADANIHPEADDPVGDGIDQNCDGADGGGSGGAGGGGGSGGGAGGGGGSGG
jgi:hypothetical protein